MDVDGVAKVDGAARVDGMVTVALLDVDSIAPPVFSIDSCI